MFGKKAKKGTKRDTENAKIKYEIHKLLQTSMFSFQYVFFNSNIASMIMDKNYTSN